LEKSGKLTSAARAAVAHWKDWSSRTGVTVAFDWVLQLCRALDCQASQIAAEKAEMLGAASLDVVVCCTFLTSSCSEMRR